jgi:SSS family solute:Na+ symporter
MALVMIRVKSALDAWWELAGIFSGGMLGLFLLGLISRRANNAAAATGVAMGVLVILWMSLSSRLSGDWAWLRSPFHNFLVTVMGTLTILLVGMAISRLSRPGLRRALR